MSITTLPAADVFRTAPAKGGVSGVDREGKRILGASVIELGAVNDDRPWDVDEATLESVVSIANASPKGVKARFTHPGMSNDGLGKFLGRWTNFRRDGNRVVADLNLANAAFTSPSGDLGTYVMNLAEEDPEAFGNSLAVKRDLKAMASTRKNGRERLRLAVLHAVDVVDDPAATRSGMFSVDLSDPRDIPEVVTQFLDANFSGATPEVIRGRLDGLLSRYFELRGLSMADQNADLGRKDEGEKTPEPQPQPTPTPEPAPQPAPVPPGGKSAEAVDFSAQLAAERQRVKAIHAVCGMAKVPAAKVNEFIDGGADLATVNLFCSQHLSATNPPVTADPPEPESDPDAKFKAEYEADAVFVRKSGVEPVSLEAYIKSRKRTA